MKPHLIMQEYNTVFDEVLSLETILRDNNLSKEKTRGVINRINTLNQHCVFLDNMIMIHHEAMMKKNDLLKIENFSTNHTQDEIKELG